MKYSQTDPNLSLASTLRVRTKAFTFILLERAEVRDPCVVDKHGPDLSLMAANLAASR